MAILEKLLVVGEVVRDKVKETFGDPQDGLTLDDDAEDGAEGASPEHAPLDVPTAYAALGLAEGSSLADVREAYRALSRYHHPIARRDGPESDAAKALDRLLEALELLEEHLVPLTGASAAGQVARPPARRKRATARR